MNVGAHPLVVAVALGLLGPNALVETKERAVREDRTARGRACEAEPGGAVGPVTSCGSGCVCLPEAETLNAEVEAAWNDLLR